MKFPKFLITHILKNIHKQIFCGFKILKILLLSFFLKTIIWTWIFSFQELHDALLENRAKTLIKRDGHHLKNAWNSHLIIFYLRFFNIEKKMFSLKAYKWKNLVSLLNSVSCVLKTCSGTKVPCVLTCSGANVSCVLTCSRATCLECLHAYVPACLPCLHAHASTSHACSRALFAYVLTWQRALRAYVLTYLRVKFLTSFEKVSFS